MIVDRLENAGMYAGLDAGIGNALAWLQETDIAGLENGRHDIVGDDVYALVQAYTTKPAGEGVWEAHRSYIDVQYVFSGVERIGYAELSKLTVTQAYDDETDCLLAAGTGDLLLMQAGTFMILAPQDAHMPGMADAEPMQVQKVVIKVRT